MDLFLPVLPSRVSPLCRSRLGGWHCYPSLGPWHPGRLSKLAQFQLSFLGWYLLCLLVLPLLYVAPYTGASMAIYARYLIERDNLIPRQESPTGRIVDQDYIDLGPQPD